MKAKLFLVSLALPLAVFAAEKAPGSKIAGDKDAQLMSDMKALEDSVNAIQKGFLYGNKEMVEKGVALLKGSNKIASLREQLPAYLPESKKALYKNAFKEGIKINSYADQMLKTMGEKKFSEAYGNYAKILNSCNTCHLIIRGWK